MSDLIASGTVVVQSLRMPFTEWEEKVEVFERDLEDEHIHTVEDAARYVAREQAGGQVQTHEVDVS